MEEPLAGKLTLVTGASRGIGAAIARRFAAAGSDLVLAARTATDLDAVAEEGRALGRRVLTVPTDMRDRVALEELAAQAAAFGAVDILVNNAGLGHFAPVWEMGLDEWDEMMALNLRAVFYLTKLIVPAMIAQGRGQIINIASTAGHRAFPRGAGYNTTKFGLRGFSEAIQKDLRPHGVRVTMLSPARVNTHFPGAPMWENDLWPEDLAEAALFAAALRPNAGVREIVMVSQEQEW